MARKRSRPKKRSKPKPRRKAKTASKRKVSRKTKVVREPSYLGPTDFDSWEEVDSSPDLERVYEDDEDFDALGGAQDLYEGVYSREEIAEYLDQLADHLDMDVSDLYDMYYGYSDDQAA